MKRHRTLAERSFNPTLITVLCLCLLTVLLLYGQHSRRTFIAECIGTYQRPAECPTLWERPDRSDLMAPRRTAARRHR